MPGDGREHRFTIAPKLGFAHALNSRQLAKRLRARFGHVVDFADLHFGEFRPFLIFNVADAAISIAVVIMLLRAFLPGKDHDEGREPRETIDHA